MSIRTLIQTLKSMLGFYNRKLTATTAIVSCEHDDEDWSSLAIESIARRDGDKYVGIAISCKKK